MIILNTTTNKEISGKPITPVIKNLGTGKIMVSPKEINYVFQEFYSKSYKPDKESNLIDISSFLSNIELPRFNREEADKSDVAVPLNEHHRTL